MSLTSTPSILTAPSSVSYSLDARYPIVVLPDPLGPTSAVSSPALAVNEMFSIENRSSSMLVTAFTGVASVCDVALAAGAWLGDAPLSCSGDGGLPRFCIEGDAELLRICDVSSADGVYVNVTSWNVTSPLAVDGFTYLGFTGSTIVGLMSIYSNMRSNSANDPDISTPRSSRFAIGNRSLACMVVNATMSPSDTLSLPSMISIPPISHTNAGAIVKNA